MRFTSISQAVAAVTALGQVASAAVAHEERDGTCKKTTVAILGGGMAGITAAQALHNASISDFVILEYQDRIGGRAKKTNFGKQDDGSPYVVELGANWIQGLGNKHGPENPVWTLSKKYHLKNTYSNYSSILTYNETGYYDFTDILDAYDEAAEEFSVEAGRMLAENVQDRSARAGLSLVGWNPKHSDMTAQAAEYWSWDWETAFPPEESSMIFGAAGDNLTFNQFGDANNLVVDPRGYAHIIEAEARTFLKKNDKRLMLSKHITDIKYSDDGVTIHNSDGSCVQAAYAICTFSLGVLRNDVVNFKPELPNWKKSSVYSFDMGTYTKIFYQFNETFWPEETQYFLYASPEERGRWALWQTLTPEGFLPGSNIIFATVTNDESYRIEQLSDEEAMKEGLEVLKQMFPDKDIPEPEAFMFPRWTKTPWAYGSYSNWPIGTTLEMHQNLRANVGRLWFAGEATSAEYFGFLHGAWFEGREAAMQIAGLLQHEKCVEVYNGEKQCGTRKHYPELKGTSPLNHYNVLNGWAVSSLAESKRKRAV